MFNGHCESGRLLLAMPCGVQEKDLLPIHWLTSTGSFGWRSYWAMDKQDNLYAGDTSVGRVTKIVAPAR